MAIKYEKIQPGMVLFQRRRYTMGNTTMKSVGEWPVKIIRLENGGALRGAIVSWNGNREHWWSERELTTLYDWSMYGKDVVVTKNICGSVIKVRKMTKAEIKARNERAGPK